MLSIKKYNKLKNKLGTANINIPNGNSNYYQREIINKVTNNENPNISRQKSNILPESEIKPEMVNQNTSISSINSSKYKNELNDSLTSIKGYFLLKKMKYTYFGLYNNNNITFISNNNIHNKKSTTSLINDTNLDSNFEINQIKKEKEGFGIITWEDKSKLYATFIKNKATGFAKYKDRKNKTLFKGEYQNNKPKGYGIYKNKNETFYEGIWIKNILNNIGIINWKDGTLYKGELNENKRNGIGIYKWNDGTLYEGEWKDDQMDGFCIIIYNGDKKYEGQIKNGVLNGYGEFSWGYSKKYIGNYQNDIKSGFGIYVWDIDLFQCYIGFWKNGKMNGIGIKIKGNVIKYGFWKNGNKEFWFDNFESLMNFYKTGKRISKNGVVSDFHSELMRKSFKLNEKENQCYFNFMKKSCGYLKDFILAKYFYNNQKNTLIDFINDNMSDDSDD